MFNYDPRISFSSKTDIIQNIMSSFSSMYLTMISIVQGVALGLLAAKVPKIIDFPCLFTSTGDWDSILIALSSAAYIVTTFLFIVLTWHSYFWLAAIARWVPAIWDSILFFVYGAFEFMLIDSLSHLDSFAWFYCFAFIGVISGFQYIYNSQRLNDKKKEKYKTLTNNVFIINIWQEDVEGLGCHVTNYKKDRAKKMWIISSIFFLIVTVLDLIEPNSRLSLEWASVTVINFFKGSLIGVILAMHLYLIRAHIKTQKETLSYLYHSAIAS